MKKGALSGWKEHECSFLSVSPALGLWHGGGELNSLKKGYAGVCEKEREKEIEGDRAVVCQSVCVRHKSVTQGLSMAACMWHILKPPACEY